MAKTALKFLMASCITSIPGVSAQERHCEGGTAAECQCLLSCPIFGSNPAKCNSNMDKSQVIQEAVLAAAELVDTECDSMKCIMACAKQLQCPLEAVSHKCGHVKRSRSTCDVDCGDTTTLTTTFTLTLTSTSTSTSNARASYDITEIESTISHFLELNVSALGLTLVAMVIVSALTVTLFLRLLDCRLSHDQVPAEEPLFSAPAP